MSEVDQEGGTDSLSHEQRRRDRADAERAYPHHHLGRFLAGSDTANAWCSGYAARIADIRCAPETIARPQGEGGVEQAVGSSVETTAGGPFVVADGGDVIGRERYRCWSVYGIPAWTLDSDEALQFARRKDAEAFALDGKGTWHVMPVPRNAEKAAGQPSSAAETPRQPYGWIWEWSDGQIKFVFGKTCPGDKWIPLYR